MPTCWQSIGFISVNISTAPSGNWFDRVRHYSFQELALRLLLEELWHLVCTHLWSLLGLRSVTLWLRQNATEGIMKSWILAALTVGVLPSTSVHLFAHLGVDKRVLSTREIHEEADPEYEEACFSMGRMT